MGGGDGVLGSGEIDVHGGGEDDCLGAKGGVIFEGRGSGIIFLIHFPYSFLKPILVRVPMV